MSGKQSKVSGSNTITYIEKGDIFTSEKQVIVNPVNTVGVMGKGLALRFKNEFPAMFEHYKQLCKEKTVAIGEPYLYKDERQWILNFPTKNNWRDSSKIEYITKGLQYLVEHAQEWGIESIALPALGCGLGKLSWLDVYPIMITYLSQLNIPIEIYSEYPNPKKRTVSTMNPDFFSPKGKKISPVSTADISLKVEEDNLEGGNKLEF